MINCKSKYLKYKKKYLILKNKILGGRFSEKQFEDIKKSYLSGKTESDNPTFYIKYGPPASGKGSIMNTVIIEENKSNLYNKTVENIVSIDIDSMIEQHDTYKNDKKNILNDKLILLNSDKSYDYLNPGDKEKQKLELNQKLQKLYWTYRKDKNINDFIKGDDLSDAITEEAMKKKFDIAWETTGYDVVWTIENTIPLVNKHGYRKVIVYPLVPVEDLLKRANAREIDTGQTPANNIEEIAKKAAKNISELKDHVDVIYIYDNSGKMNDDKTLLIKYEKLDNLDKDLFKLKFKDYIITILTKHEKCHKNLDKDLHKLKFKDYIIDSIDKIC